MCSLQRNINRSRETEGRKKMFYFQCEIHPLSLLLWLLNCTWFDSSGGLSCTLWVFSLFFLTSAGSRWFAHIKPKLQTWFRTRLTSVDILPVPGQWDQHQCRERKIYWEQKVKTPSSTDDNLFNINNMHFYTSQNNLALANCMLNMS